MRYGSIKLIVIRLWANINKPRITSLMSCGRLHVFLSICSSIYLTVWLCVSQTVCLLAWLSIWRSLWQTVLLSECQSVDNKADWQLLVVSLPYYPLSLSLSWCLSVCFFLCLSLDRYIYLVITQNLPPTFLMLAAMLTDLKSAGKFHT